MEMNYFPNPMGIHGTSREPPAGLLEKNLEKYKIDNKHIVFFLFVRCPYFLFFWVCLEMRPQGQTGGVN